MFTVNTNEIPESCSSPGFLVRQGKSPAIGLCHVLHMCCQCIRQLSVRQAPFPVVSKGGREVHAGFSSESEPILHRDHCGSCG